MYRSLSRIRGIGFIVWHARHMVYHFLLGGLWAWVLGGVWHEMNAEWILVSLVGSVLPDAEHLLYFATYGRHDPYTKSVRHFLKSHQWRMTTAFIEKGHKQNTNLRFHNVYIIGLLLFVACFSLFHDLKMWVVLFGSMIIHYLFDIADDYVTLGYLNSNWKRWGRPKQTI